MDIKELQNKTLKGIEECQAKIEDFKQQFHYWTGYKDCLKALDLHLKMEKIKEWTNTEVNEKELNHDS